MTLAVALYLAAAVLHLAAHWHLRRARRRLALTRARLRGRERVRRERGRFVAFVAHHLAAQARRGADPTTLH